MMAGMGGVEEATENPEQPEEDAEQKEREEAERKGEKFPQSSPQMELWAIQNNDTESHEKAAGILEFFKLAMKQDNCPAEAKALMEKWVSEGIPAMGESFELPVPHALVNQMHTLYSVLGKALNIMKANVTEAQYKEYVEEVQPKALATTMGTLINNYVAARDEVMNDANDMKNFFRSQAKNKDSKATKADVLKEIWAELPKHTDQPVPPLDEEMLTELAAEPAIIEGEFMHSWGTADKLYKSEAIDAFGGKYLLGVFETKEEARKAFADWNSEYETARNNMKDELEQWGKQEQARLDADPEPMERIKKVLEQARR